ncbi:hypothetical protein Tco_1001449 [Tanacetum coccineum]
MQVLLRNLHIVLVIAWLAAILFGSMLHGLLHSGPGLVLLVSGSARQCLVSVLSGFIVWRCHTIDIRVTVFPFCWSRSVAAANDSWFRFLLFDLGSAASECNQLLQFSILSGVRWFKQVSQGKRVSMNKRSTRVNGSAGANGSAWANGSVGAEAPTQSGIRESNEVEVLETWSKHGRSYRRTKKA